MSGRSAQERAHVQRREGKLLQAFVILDKVSAQSSFPHIYLKAIPQQHYFLVAVPEKILFIFLEATLLDNRVEDIGT